MGCGVGSGVGRDPNRDPNRTCSPMMMNPSININSVMMKNRMSRPARESVSQSRFVLGERRRYFITLNMHRKIDVESTMNIRLYL